MVTSKLPQASSSSSSGKQLKKPFSKLFCLWRKTNINLPRERLGLYRRFTFKEVQAATGNFRFKIASGGYSDVFRGCIGNGDDEYPVAFRRGRGHPFDFEETQDSVSTGPPSDRSEPLVEMEIADLGSPNLEFTDSDYEILGRGR
ncbi:nsp-interacting kinase 2 [Corchorus capsularis]|uniref:Nsp-interacting kinase 2 n=1 Tax=Corchorus capsularis TaxID=210143 RepID=A0A1R3JXC1_COCAP|nr:nsp-interacting kinase 2 [Corchorus capsularis]